MNSYFTNKVFALTGGASGMGAATAHLLASNGARVSLADTNSALLQSVKESIESASVGQCITTVVDVRDPAQVRAWIENTITVFGKLDGCANFAGIASPDFLTKTVDEIDDKWWQYTIDVNLTGTMNSIRAQIPHMNDGGSIVNVSSILGQVGLVKGADYGVSKFGVIGLSKCAAKELAPKGIRVNAIAPGAIDTPLMQPALGKFETVIGAPWETCVPMGRMGKPQEIADLVEFLLSNKSTYITGSVITIDGGFTA